MIKHVLKDGTILDDISGHVVKKDEAKQFYLILGKINEGKCYESKFGKENTCNS